MPLVLHNAEELHDLLPLFTRWRALGRPITLHDLLTLPQELIDNLLTLEWLNIKVNEDHQPNQ